MTNEQVNRLITENLFGECWHEPVHEKMPWPPCKNCGETLISRPNENNDFFTWEGFGRLWEKLIEQTWWPDFVKRHGTYCWDKSSVLGQLGNHGDDRLIKVHHIREGLINPSVLSPKAAEYGVKELGWK